MFVWTDDEYLHGELRATNPQTHRFHIHAQDEQFVEEDGVVYRTGRVLRTEIDARTGNKLAETVIRVNHARVMYDIDKSKRK